MNPCKKYSPSKVNECVVLMNIEYFVKRLIENPKATFYGTPFNIWLSLYNPYVYDYSEYLNAFWYGCHYAGLFELESLQYKYIDVEKLISGILMYVNSPSFKRSLYDQRYQTKKNREGLESYIELVQNKYSRALVIRIDFGYYGKNAGYLSISHVFEHLDIMNSLRYKHPLFEHLIASGWCVEQGVEKGYHIHAFYCFKGSQHQEDWHLAQEIGKLWQGITQEYSGVFYNCNTPEWKEKYNLVNRLGIGMVHRNDSVACENMSLALGYLAKPEKDDQYLRMKPKGRRTFGRGLIHH